LWHRLQVRKSPPTLHFPCCGASPLPLPSLLLLLRRVLLWLILAG
jgi:hypothetical protein